MKITKKSLIIGGSVLVAGLLFFIVLPSFSDDTLKSQFGTATGLGPDANIIQSEVIFLGQIQQLQDIDLSNVSLFKDSRFVRLVDNTQQLDEFEAGRVEPYAPIDARVRVQETQRRASQAAAAREQALNNIAPNQNLIPTNAPSTNSGLQVPEEAPVTSSATNPTP